MRATHFTILCLIPILFLAVGCGGGGSSSGGNGGTVDTTGPTIGTASTGVSKTSAGAAYHQFSLTVTDASGVASVDVQVTGPDGFDQTVALSVSGDVWSGQVQVSPPLLGSDIYDYVVTAADGVGNESTDGGQFTVEGTSPPSTVSAPF
jgi:hypothetical protein